MSKLRTSNQTGFSIIELMIAIVVLAVGLTATISLVIGAIAANNRNKMDTSATMLAQNVMEEILAANSNAIPPPVFQVTDCNNTVFNINAAGAAGPAGLGATLTAAGNINFAGNAPAGYGMNYVVCKSTGTNVTYDVRWNIINLRTGANGEIYTKQVTIAARPIAAANASGIGSGRLYALPITLKGVAGILQ
jgi:prepilin-type N-terminal cleavage/methylation domain-containing protein